MPQVRALTWCSLTPSARRSSLRSTPSRSALPLESLSSWSCRSYIGARTSPPSTTSMSSTPRNYNLPKYGLGSSSDWTQTSMVNGLKKLKDLQGCFIGVPRDHPWPLNQKRPPRMSRSTSLKTMTILKSLKSTKVNLILSARKSCYLCFNFCFVYFSQFFRHVLSFKLTFIYFSQFLGL